MRWRRRWKDLLYSTAFYLLPRSLPSSQVEYRPELSSSNHQFFTHAGSFLVCISETLKYGSVNMLFSTEDTMMDSIPLEKNCLELHIWILPTSRS
ncbi:hypothetical protein GGU11DRAFT_780498, partial [Lentinula aff. detonsa]